MSKLSEQARKQIRKVFEQTGSIRATAKETGISRNAVRRELYSHKHPARQIKHTAPRESKLDPFKSKIDFLAREKQLSGVRILEEIRELGYQGGYSILKEYLNKTRPRPKRRPSPPIFHNPGQEGQMDWSPHSVIIGGRQQIVHTGSIVLCFSRWLFIRHFLDETLENVISLHEQAFQELGAVPKIMTYDNMTTVGWHRGPNNIWINPRFQRFAEEYGFKVVILPPGKKERHGKVERPFHYIENNFLKGREFRDLEDLNNKADTWRANTANVRIHGTVRERPADRLQREKSFLIPLPSQKLEMFYKEVERVVHPDYCIRLDNSSYSVDPDLVEERVKVRIYRDHLEIWFQGSLHCRHTYTAVKGERQILPEHEEKYKEQSGQKQLLEKAFLRLGDTAREYYQGLQREKNSAAGYHMQRILHFTENYGPEVVLGAINHAIKYGAYDSNTILRIIKGKKFKSQNTAPLPQNVQQWLRTQAVEKQNLSHFDKLVGDSNEREE